MVVGRVLAMDFQCVLKGLGVDRNRFTRVIGRDTEGEVRVQQLSSVKLP